MTRSATVRRGDWRDCRGLLLVECVAYLSLWMVVVGVSLRVFYGAYTQSKHLTRNADDVVRLLNVGEQWRAEVRRSVRSPRWEMGAEGAQQELVLGDADQWIAYRTTATNLLRRTAANPTWREVCGGLQSCRFHRDERGPVVSWRWEVEVKPRVRAPRVEPRFTFQAVTGAAEQP